MDVFIIGDTAVSLAQEDAEMTALLLAGTSQWQSLAFKKPPIDGAGSNSSSSVAADTAAAEHVKSSRTSLTSFLTYLLIMSVFHKTFNVILIVS